MNYVLFSQADLGQSCLKLLVLMMCGCKQRKEILYPLKRMTLENLWNCLRARILLDPSGSTKQSSIVMGLCTWY